MGVGFRRSAHHELAVQEHRQEEAPRGELGDEVDQELEDTLQVLARLDLHLALGRDFGEAVEEGVEE